jgi:uncharacterized damage-inducible protein DinB
MSDKALRELVYGKGAHADTLACVENVSPELATKTVAAYPHSIWQIVEHMNYWMDYDLKKISGDAPAYPEHAIESWPAAPVHATEDNWEAVTGRFSGLLMQLARLAESDAQRLDRVVSDAGSSQTLRPPTVREVVMQISAHNSYHAGQIALLRRQSGAWPPRRGGDTW